MFSRGHLSDLFEGVVVKKLTLVETVTEKSNQHEFQGTKALRQLLGAEDRRRIPARFIWFPEDETPVSEDGFVSWSNVRRGKPRAPEFHLYYSSNPVTEGMRPGDSVFLALRKDQSILTIVVPADSTVLSQLLWLFDLPDSQIPEDVYRDIRSGKTAELDFAARYILDEIGIDAHDQDVDPIDVMLEHFAGSFPSTRVFSDLARSSLPDIRSEENADRALLSWMEREELMFKRLERSIVSQRLTAGFISGGDADVDGFLSFSLSVQNRRKARAGQALENHLEAIFRARGLSFARGAETENRNRPDFLFPSVDAYHDPSFQADRLTMLGAKSTVKDRWRQVLSEAARIDRKHLLTLEPGISEHQTRQMQSEGLQLVIPLPLHATFRETQRDQLMSLEDFVCLVAQRQ